MSDHEDILSFVDEDTSLTKKKSKQSLGLDDVDFSNVDKRGYPVVGGSSYQANLRVVCSLVVVGGLLLLMIVCSLVVVGGLASFSGIGEAEPVQAFYETVQFSNVKTHLSALQAISDQYGGRSLHQGFNASVEYVEALLTETDYNVWRQEFTIQQTELTQAPSFMQIAPDNGTYVVGVDYDVIDYSGSGSAEAAIAVVLGDGCLPANYAIPAGTVALSSYSRDCSLYERTMMATDAGAVALLVYNTKEQSEPLSGSLGSAAEADPSAITIPVLGLTFKSGFTLATTPGATVSVDVSMETKTVTTMNLLADTPTGSPDSQIVIGSHLDSKPNVAGINDNGSGSMVNLEVALQLYRSNISLASQVRFAWWSAEELGLLGSQAYVASLTEEDISKTALNINYDMLGSPNFFRGILNGYEAEEPITVSCTKLTQVFEDFYNSINLPYAMTEFNGRSDYGSFLAVNITAGGLKTGAEVLKTAAERDTFGGMVDAPFDPCYHLFCDTYDNVHDEILAENMQAAAYAVQTLGTQENLWSYLGLA